MKTLFKKASWLTCVALGCSLAPQSANACGQDPFLAGMCVFAGNFAPRGYALAQGQILPINQNQSLYSLLGTTYGGDGRTSFGLPDLRGRVAISSGQGSGLSSYTLGQRGGQEFVTLSVQEIPSHTHIATTTVTGDIDNTAINAGATISLSGIAVRGTSKNPTGNSLATINARRSGHYTDAAPDVPMANEAASITVDVAQTTATATTTVGTAGGVAHENRMPYIAMNWIIVTQGIFPSRN
jgi:microcystin-dependent protein